MERGTRGPYKKVPVELDEVFVDMSQSKDKRVRSYVKQVKDPYLVKIDGVVVEMEYAEDGPTMEELVELAIGID